MEEFVKQIITRKDKCELAIKKGYNYNPETGVIVGPNGYSNNTKRYGYINLKINTNNKRYNLAAHQFAWYWVNKEIVDCIDHINGVKDDNRICNLRSVTKQQNQQNMVKAKGYSWHKGNQKYSSQITINYEQKFLGYFDTEDEARECYLEAKNKYHKI